jgi:hypothetical protein
MNELTLHYVTQADRERTIEETLRDRQSLEDAARATRAQAQAQYPAAQHAEAPAIRDNPKAAPRPTTIRTRARATGR